MHIILIIQPSRRFLYITLILTTMKDVKKVINDLVREGAEQVKNAKVIGIQVLTKKDEAKNLFVSIKTDKEFKTFVEDDNSDWNEEMMPCFSISLLSLLSSIEQDDTMCWLASGIFRPLVKQFNKATEEDKKDRLVQQLNKELNKFLCVSKVDVVSVYVEPGDDGEGNDNCYPRPFSDKEPERKVEHKDYASFIGEIHYADRAKAYEANA